MPSNKQVICANCGEPMQQTHTRSGLKLYVCLHNTAKLVKTRTGLPKHALVYCTAKVFGLKTAFDNMTANTDLTIQKLRKATDDKIDDASLYKSANLALELKFDAKILPKLFGAAMTLGYSLGITAQKSIESLVIGIARKSRLVLDNIGVVFLAETAYKWYRESQLASGALTEEERHKAWTEYAIKQVIETAEQIRKTAQETMRAAT